MSCAHSTQPGPCSQCAGAIPRIVTTNGGAVFVDGEHVRTGGPARSVYTTRAIRASKARRVQR